jgi:radical SAM-linked protein
MEKNAPTVRPDSPSLQSFLAILAIGPPEPEAFRQLLEALERERRLEHALTLLKQSRPDLGRWAGALAELKAAVAKGRERRMNLWQIDPHRRTLRLCFSVHAPACSLHPPALLASLGRMFLDAGLPLAMGLEKNPRPAVRLGHPLPLEVEGWREWADAVLQEDPGVALEALAAQLNGQAPAGLRVLEVDGVPNHASAVADLCRWGHWQWPCPETLAASAREAVARFAAADRFEIAKAGKVDGQKGARPVDIRPLLLDLRWDGPLLCFRTRIGKGEAANPRKLLAAILAVPAEQIQGLARTEVQLDEDPRLLNEERYAPKLHNMFEDAVLLGSGSNIRIVDEDDDDPVVLG